MNNVTYNNYLYLNEDVYFFDTLFKKVLSTDQTIGQKQKGIPE